MTTRHHVAICRTDAGSGWEMLERPAGSSEWHKLSLGNPAFGTLLHDALEHCGRTWDMARHGSQPDLTICFSPARAVRAMPPLDDAVLVDGRLHDDWKSSLTIFLPIGIDTTPTQWTTLIRPGFCGELSAGGRLNGLNLKREIDAFFAANNTMAKFEMRNGVVSTDLEQVWVRPAWRARGILPEQFPLPPRRSEEQQAAFEALVARNRAKQKKNAERRLLQERGAANAAMLARTDSEA
jgi:hypothetical protein